MANTCHYCRLGGGGELTHEKMFALLMTDHFCDVPNIFSDSGSNRNYESKDSVITRSPNKTACPLSDYSESDSSDDDNNDIKNLVGEYTGQNRPISYLSTFYWKLELK
jgi:hypothetical protein